MADPMKKFIKHMEGVNAAKHFDAAARATAEHCDKRIEKIHTLLRRIRMQALDGEAGTGLYAKDRLVQIRKIVDVALKK